MFTHIALIKLIHANAETIELAREMLSGLEGKIPQCRQLEVGVNLVQSYRSYDLSLVVSSTLWKVSRPTKITRLMWKWLKTCKGSASRPSRWIMKRSDDPEVGRQWSVFLGPRGCKRRWAG